MGKMIFYDRLRNRYFEYSEDEINKAITELNDIQDSIYLINLYHKLIGLPLLKIKGVYEFNNLDEVKTYIDEIKSYIDEIKREFSRLTITFEIES